MVLVYHQFAHVDGAVETPMVSVSSPQVAGADRAPDSPENSIRSAEPDRLMHGTTGRRPGSRTPAPNLGPPVERLAGPTQPQPRWGVIASRSNARVTPPRIIASETVALGRSWRWPLHARHPHRSGRVDKRNLHHVRSIIDQQIDLGTFRRIEPAEHEGGGSMRPGGRPTPSLSR